MLIYYSGASAAGVSQRLPAISLGGYIGSDTVPNGRINAFFDNISDLAIQSQTTLTRAFFIKNTLGRPVSNVILYLIYPDGTRTAVINVAAVVPVANQIEKIASSLDTPFYADFYDAEVRYARTLATITEPVIQDEEITIEGVTIIAQADGNVSFINQVVAAFSTNPQYEALIGILPDTFELRYRQIGVNTNTPIITTFFAVITAPAFDGGIDNSLLLKTTLAPNETLGLWLKRELIPVTAATNHELFDAYVLNNYLPATPPAAELIRLVLEYV